MKRIYLDHAAATPVDPGVKKAMDAFLVKNFANPSAIHRGGVEAKMAITEARNEIAGMLGVHGDEIVFTGSATESCNLALSGTISAWRKAHPERTPHVIVSAIEHDAVLSSAKVLEQSGVRVSIVPVDEDGIVDPRTIGAAICDDTVIISVMYANNEIGTIEPLADIARVIRKWKKEHRGVVRDRKITGDELYPLFHTDATQAVNYLDIHMPKLGVDLLSMNASKIYGPKGIGLLAVLRGVPIDPAIVGGGQERGRRAGTENVPGIVGLAAALRTTRKMAAKESARLTKLRELLIARTTKDIPDIVVNGSREMRIPNNIHLSIPGPDHEYLALLLDARGFAVSTKSACNEADAETSHVLAALSRTEGYRPLSGLRITLGRSTSREDIISFARALKEIVDRHVVRSGK